MSFLKATSKAQLPKGPITYSWIIKPPNGPAEVMGEGGNDGGFALTLPPRPNVLQSLEIHADAFGPGSFAVPLEVKGSLAFRAPQAGCVYIGRISVIYGRLPKGSVKSQSAIVQSIAIQAKLDNLIFVYHPNGGLLVAGGNVTLPSKAKRVEGSEGCKVRLVKHG